MDEVDGMGAGDRGGMAELILLIKKTKVCCSLLFIQFLLIADAVRHKTPIICICNDRMDQKVRSLANYCLDMRFHRYVSNYLDSSLLQLSRRGREYYRPTPQMIRSRIMSIAFK